MLGIDTSIIGGSANLVFLIWDWKNCKGAQQGYRKKSKTWMIKNTTNVMGIWSYGQIIRWIWYRRHPCTEGMQDPSLDNISYEEGATDQKVTVFAR